MDRQPEITDEELNSFKNFDSLLNKHYRILNEKRPAVWKFIVPLVILIGSVAIYWLTTSPDSKPVDNNVSTLDSLDGLVLPDKTIKDSSAEPARSDNEKKAIIKGQKTNPSKADNQNAQWAVEAVSDSVEIKEEKPVAVPAVTQTDSNVVNPKAEAVYIQAEPIDGYEALYAYFGKELIYPEAAVKDSVEGVMVVKFLINKEGKPEKIQTSGSLGVLFEKEAVRLIEHMPLWKPATLNGKPVVSRLSIPLTFQLQKN